MINVLYSVERGNEFEYKSRYILIIGKINIDKQKKNHWLPLTGENTYNTAVANGNVRGNDFNVLS